MLKKTKQLCEQSTALKPSDIDIILETAASMSLFAELSESCIFIDCLSRDSKHAIVVAEAFGERGKTLYSQSILGKNVFEIFEPGVFYSLFEGKKSIIKHAINQEGKSVHQTVIPLKNDQAQIIGVLIQEKPLKPYQDSNDRHDSLSIPSQVLDIILPYDRTHLPILSDLLIEMFILTDRNHKLLYANPVGLKFLLELTHTDQVQDVDLTELHDLFKEVYEENKEDVYVFERMIGDRSLVIKKVKLKHAEDTTNTLLIIQDLTELKMKEKELSMKTILIEEVHHRVKNNLQTIASLLRLQMHQAELQVGKDQFEVALNRIYSISSVHEIILSNRESTSEFVNIIELVKKVSSNLVLDPVYEKIDLQLETNQLKILTSQKQAVSLSLIINELTQNILKHAFKASHAGEILIEFKIIDQMIQIHIVDNGMGVGDFQPSLGLNIVRSLVENDLAGQFEFLPTEAGTHAMISFNINSEVVVDFETDSNR